jgi:hypothetical protein
VVEVGEDEKVRGPKIGCSIKLVDQGDGTDLDPQVGVFGGGMGAAMVYHTVSDSVFERKQW